MILTLQTFYVKSKIETSDWLFEYSHYCLESLRLSALVANVYDMIVCLVVFLSKVLFTIYVTGV